MKMARRNENGPLDIRTVTEGPAASAQVAIYESLGFTSVEEAEKPDDTPYVLWTPTYEETEAGGFREVYRLVPRVIPLDRDKLIAAVVRMGMLEQAIEVFSGNEDARKWWADSMVYVEGSPMAQAFMQTFGLSLDQVHALVEEARQ